MSKKAKGFDVVLEAARALPDVERDTTWGAFSLKSGGKLLACQAIHKSAEPDSLVVKIPMEQRAELIAADPAVYYVTDHYVNYPSVLVRLPRIHPDALRDLLGMSWRFAHQRKTTKSGGRRTSSR